MSPESFCECCSRVMPTRYATQWRLMPASKVNDEPGVVRRRASCMMRKFMRSHGDLLWRMCIPLSGCGTERRIGAFRFAWLKTLRNDFQTALCELSKTRVTILYRY